MIHWLTTNANPRLPNCSEKHGWKMHAVEGPDNAKLEDVRKTRALCGLRARHGWGFDLFIEAKCVRCERKVNESLNNQHVQAV